MRWLWLLALLVAPAHAATYALVVGNNAPLPGSGYRPLAYADDDALRVAELLGALGAEVTLLAAPDAATTDRLSGEVAGAPTRAAVLAAFARLAERAGPDDEVWFYFSGHGSVSGARADLHLADGPLSRTDLHSRLLRPLRQARLHVIIDACHAWFMVNARGRVRVPTQELERLDQYPRAGFLLSTSRQKEVHEWAGYQGGVFTHQLLGALRGAADVDANGQVTYAETHAYLVAANLGITDARARIEPHVRRPAAGSQTLVSIEAYPELRVAQVAAALTGRLYLDDARGERLLDAHKAAGAPLAVLVPPNRRVALHLDGETYTVRAGVFVPDAPEGAVVSRRGLLADEFRKHLFAQPLTADFVAGFEAGVGIETAAPPPTPARPWTDDPVAVGLLVGAGVSLAAGGVLTPLYLDARADADARPITADTEDAAGRATRLQVGMASAWAAGSALLTAAVLRIVFAEP